MEQIVIEGGVPLRGAVCVSGAKNATLPMLAASLLTDGVSVIDNVPLLRDVATAIRLLECLGARVHRSDDRQLTVDASEASSQEASYSLVRTMRASVLVLGPLLARFGRARVSLPGGCAIGERPIDQHLKGLEAMGASVRLEHGYIVAEAPELRGANICLDVSTVTGTENLMMAAALARGKTLIVNAAQEPEVVNLAEVLQQMGATVEGAGTDTIVVEGAMALGGFHHSVIPDRIEAGTFMVAAAITGGSVEVCGCEPRHLSALIGKLREAGVRVQAGEDSVQVEGIERLRAVDATTVPYPGFPTDMQAQMMALMTVAEGTSVITETVFEKRFVHVSELLRMAADITMDRHSAIVRGVEALSAAEVMATDLRASASLILAGLAAGGQTRVSRIYHIDRGYEKIEEKLDGLGARIWRT